MAGSDRGGKGPPTRRFRMRRGSWIGFTVLAIVLAVAIGAGAYHWGFVNGLQANGHVSVVGTVGYGGFFPFGFLLFPLLFFFLFFGIARAAFWGRHGWHDHDHPHGPMGPGGWNRRGELEDWHRRQHEPAEGAGGSAGAMPFIA
jgi:hypothetical protein